MNSDLGEIILDFRPSRFRRNALAIVLVPIGSALVLWSCVLVAARMGVFRHDGARQVPVGFMPFPFAAGLLMLVSTWWYRSRQFRCHALGVSTLSIFGRRQLAFHEMKGIRMRGVEFQLLGLLTVIRSVEIWFDPKSPLAKSIAVDSMGLANPRLLAERISLIAKATGVCSVWL